MEQEVNTTKRNRRTVPTIEPIIRERLSKKIRRISGPEIRAREEHNRHKRNKSAHENLEKMEAAVQDDSSNYTIRHVRIPFWILDEYLHKLSRTATKVLLAIAKHATFDPERTNHAMCWLTHHQIAEYAGISPKAMRRYEKELEGFGLISVSYSQSGGDGGFTTIHTYTINFMKIFARSR